MLGEKLLKGSKVGDAEFEKPESGLNPEGCCFLGKQIAIAKEGSV